MYNFKGRDFAYGNYFHVELDDGDSVIVQCYSVDTENKETLFVGWGCFKWRRIKPIKITPERLKKTSFRPDRRDNGCWEKAGFRLIPRKKTESWHIAGVRGADIRYFHELQNIIFSIKGKELRLHQLSHNQQYETPRNPA